MEDFRKAFTAINAYIKNKINNRTLHLKELPKKKKKKSEERTNKPKVSGRKEITKIIKEINKTLETQFKR